MTHITIRFSILLLLAMSSASIAQDKTGKKLFCWNENGRKVCGDTLPQSAVDSARTEISAKSGLAVGSVDRSLNADERTAAAAAAGTAAAEARAVIDAQRKDLAMVESYATEADLRRAYGARITLLDESLKTSRLSTVNLRLSLLSLLRQAADLELQAQPVRKPLVDNITRQHADLLRQQEIMRQQALDRSALGSDLDTALARYRSLKGGTVPGAG